MDSDRRFVFKQDGNDSFTADPKLGNDVDESRRIRSGVLISTTILGSRPGTVIGDGHDGHQRDVIDRTGNAI